MGIHRNVCRSVFVWHAAILIGCAWVSPSRGTAQDPGQASAPSVIQNAAEPPLALAREQAALGHYVEAVGAYTLALAGPHPPVLSDTDALFFATSLAATGDIDAARQQLNQALLRSPESAALNHALGTLIAQSGQMDAALPFFQRAVAADPSLSTAQYHLGAALLALNQPDAALGPLRVAVQVTPDRFDVQLQLGKALSATHQDTEALTHLHLAAQLVAPSTSPDALYALALALQASGDARGSLPIFEAATSAPNASAAASGSAALTNYALARVQTGDAVDAIPLYKRALALGPDTPDLREDFGVAYLQQSDIDHALEQFRAGLAVDPSSAHLHYDLGLALKLKDDLAGAVPEFEQAQRLDPTLPDPPYTLGVIYMQQGRFPDAIRQLKHATELQPANGDAWALLGSILKDSDDPAGAFDALTRAVALEPDQPSLHIQLAALDMEAGKHAEAAEERKIAATLSRAANNRQRANFSLKSGRVLLDQNKIPDAILQLSNAAQADPTLAEPHLLLADAYAREGQPDKAAAERTLAASLTTSSPSKEPK
jgi:protein O-GlcNAc transferase